MIGKTNALAAAGGLSEYATGTCSPTNRSYTLTVTGLSFKPRIVVILFEPSSYTYVNLDDSYVFSSFMCADTEVYKGVHGTVLSEGGNLSTRVFKLNNATSFTPNDGGFTIDLTNAPINGFNIPFMDYYLPYTWHAFA